MSRTTIYAPLGYYAGYCVTITTEADEPHDLDGVLDEPHERLRILTDAFEGQEIILPIPHDALRWLTALRDQADAAIVRLQEREGA